jgi:deoxyribodipyrimidine photo-lyase
MSAVKTDFLPTMAAAQARINAVQPDLYARTRNDLDGAVTCLSPYITHGFVTLLIVFHGVHQNHPINPQHKLVYELGWRGFFQHVWQHRGAEIFQSLHEGPLPDSAYAHALPDDIAQACTGVPVVDEAVRTLYRTGMLHNHARMWLASYVVHIRKVHWRVGADWLYAHLLDGDLASNHLSWQWVTGTGSHKPYVFNADNVAKYAPTAWHSPGSVIDTSYDKLDALARQPHVPLHEGIPLAASVNPVHVPALRSQPLDHLACQPPQADSVDDRHVWLVHPWALGDLPPDLPDDVVVLGMVLSDFHEAWPWSERRWQFVGQRMTQLATSCWYGNADAMQTALAGARSVHTVANLHLAPWLDRLAVGEQTPQLFAHVPERCRSFSQWWKLAIQGFAHHQAHPLQQSLPAA